MNGNVVDRLISEYWYKLHIILLCLIVPSFIVMNTMIFLVVPNERVMGAVQRIFYFHVPAAIACYGAMLTVFVSSISYLKYKVDILDNLNQAASEVSLLFCTITLASGMIWAKSAWNTWFSWEPRLVSFLMLWMIVCAMNLIRIFGIEQYKQSHCAILGILGALTIPLVWLSIRFIPQAVQLHPKVVEQGGLRDTSYLVCFLLSMAVFLFFQVYLTFFRFIILKFKRELVSL